MGTLLVIISTNMLLIYAGGVLIGLATGIFFAANWALGTELVPANESGKWLGISNLAGAGAGAVGAYIGGPIGDGAGYVVLMALYGILFFFSTLALHKIKGRIKKNSPFSIKTRRSDSSVEPDITIQRSKPVGRN